MYLHGLVSGSRALLASSLTFTGCQWINKGREAYLQALGRSLWLGELYIQGIAPVEVWRHGAHVSGVGGCPVLFPSVSASLPGWELGLLPVLFMERTVKLLQMGSGE